METSPLFHLGIIVLLPLIAIIISITKRNRYWIAAIIVAFICVSIAIQSYQNEVTCQGEFCGLGIWFSALLWVTILGIIAIILSLLKAPKTIENDADRVAVRKSRWVFMVVILIPILLIIIYNLWINSLVN